MKKIYIAVSILGLTMFLLISFTTSSVTAQKGGLIQIHPQPSEQQVSFVPGRLLVGFRPDVGPDHARQIIAALGARDADEIPEIGVHILELPYHASEIAFVNAFAQRPEVEFADLDNLLHLEQVIPNDPFFNDPNAWGLQKISAPDAWAINTGSSSIIIAILDTGVDGSHPDLIANMVPGRNIVGNNDDTHDVQGHGTMVAGTAAAATNNAIGVAGVAWNCRIMPVVIADSSGYATVSDVAAGLTWAADHGARVANISFNATGYSTVSSAAKYFQSKGGVVAVAAGNGGSAVQIPDDPYILTIGATDASDSLYSWSNSGTDLDLVAPGHVVTTAPGGVYAGADGTSFATPIVAGAAALLLSSNPSLTATQVQNVLKQSADDLGAAGWDSTYGSGRLNLARALTTVPPPTEGLDTTPPTISITSPTDGGTVTSSVTVTVTASDNTCVTKVELYVDDVFYSSSARSPFNIKWSTRKAAKGGHTLQTKAYDAVGNVGVSSAISVYK
jgi:thermitase